MALESYLSLFNKRGAGFISWLVEVDLSIASTRGQTSPSQGGPIKGITFISVLEGSDFTSSETLVLSLFTLGLGLVKSFNRLLNVIDSYFVLVVPSGYDVGAMHGSDSVNATFVGDRFVSHIRIFLGFVGTAFSMFILI